MKLEEIKDGMRVRYCPMHARGDLGHPDVESGTISSKNAHFAFVKYDRQVSKLGWEGATSQATDPSDLIFG